jgi:hypothetical protein
MLYISPYIGSSAKGDGDFQGEKGGHTDWL